MKATGSAGSRRSGNASAILLRAAQGSLLGMALWLSTAAAAADSFPTRPVRIVTADAGGGSDVVSRLIAQPLTAMWGKQVVVDNRGGGVFAGDVVAHATPDGYTLLYYGSTFWILPLFRKNVPYDPGRDFVPVIQAVSTPAVLVVHPSVPVHTVSELIALAKSRPGKLNYASAALGTATHISAELFKSMAGVDIVRVPYKGTGAALIDLLGGQVQVMFAVAASVSSYVRSGKLRGLAVTTAQPSPAFPDLPTIAAAGLPGYESVQMSGLFAPAHTPAPLVARLNRDIAAALNSSEVKTRLTRSGVDVAAGSPEAFASKIRADVDRVRKLIRNVGIESK